MESNLKKNVVALLLTLSLQLSAQDVRVNTIDDFGNRASTFYPSEPIVFVFDYTDTLLISSAVDSLYTGDYLYSLYIYVNSATVIENYTLVISFETNDPIVLVPSKSDFGDGYFEYSLTKEELWLLRVNPVTGFIIYSNEKAYSCIILYNKYYLRDFLRGYR